ncbi:hypothetical protein CI109_105101 [Kwoniella shandongensis]|uniref:Uncharacterized protein n=1 Tax=Kwoniella shandongensis TaxID=1734106 RepID=A0A5M6C1X0_9TREE|nr:uncharacterized protein CI109_004299 [Kwoniella shandongensis]KAA5527239.1 hypothetical protein CI109_004299 [Kwoniella shandongensis]
MAPTPSRRSRPSLPPSTHDEISLLTLPEVRARLARNNALLTSALFVSPPSNSNSTNGAGPSSDPVRDKLIIAREALLAREKELVREEEEHVQEDRKVEGDIQQRRGSEGMRSGKRRVIESIKQGEGMLAKNGLILPIDQTLHLSERDYQNATTLALSHLSLDQTRSLSPKPRLGRPLAGSSNRAPRFVGQVGEDDDEISRAERMARLNAFMSYKGTGSEDEEEDDYDDDEDEDEEEEEEDGALDLEDGPSGNGGGRGKSAKGRITDENHFPLGGNAEGGYDGNGMPRRNEDVLGEQVDEYGEDDEVFAEGNDDYDNGGADMSSGQGR